MEDDYDEETDVEEEQTSISKEDEAILKEGGVIGIIEIPGLDIRYSFPVELAAKIAVHTVDRFLQDNPDCFDLVEWVLFDSHTESVYEVELDKIYKQ